MKLTEKVELLPILHGRITVAKAVRAHLNSNSYDTILLPLPESAGELLTDAVEDLPIITAITMETDENLFVIPTDPADPFIEAIRQGVQQNISIEFIGSDIPLKQERIEAPLDEEMIEHLGYDAWSSLVLAESQKISADPDTQALAVASAIKSRAYSKAILLYEIHHIPKLIAALKEGGEVSYLGSTFVHTRQRTIPEKHLFFLLGELPFVTGRYEQNRGRLFEKDLNAFELIKELFLETRSDYMPSKNGVQQLSLTRVQQGLKFLRNLAVLDNKLTPTLFHILTAAKGIGGDSFALEILKAANNYLFALPDGESPDHLKISIDKRGGLLTTNDGEVKPLINLLCDTEMEWKTISIKPDKELWEKRSHHRDRAHWGERGLYSHIPEDIFIENFSRHLREKGVRLLTESQKKSEPFSCSLKDGLDLRETLRNWHTGKIYVQETPFIQGGVDRVVIIFDTDHDDEYTQMETWYAEHKNESTLTFYATDPLQSLVGPGIAECRYGGLSLLYPPEPIPPIDVFAKKTGKLSSTPYYAILTEYAMIYSRKRSIPYVAEKRPDARILALAQKHKKHLIWIPLKTFSSETLRRIQHFHILNGLEVRHWADRFIGE